MRHARPPQRSHGMAMTEATAERQFPCPNCGSDLTWSPAEQALACMSCGTRLPHDPPPTTLSKFFDTVTGQGTRVDPRPRERAAYRCAGCQAVSYFERGVTVSRCPFCGAAAIAPYDAFPDRFRPESIVPFLTSEAEARAAAQAWMRRIWFAPSKLARLVRTGEFRGAYLPFWSFDAHAVAHWDRAGGVRGIIEMDFDDVLVCADRSVDAALVARLEPFPSRIYRAYDPRYAAGWSVARAQREFDEAADVAHARMQRDLLATAKPGQPAQERDSMQLRGVEYPRETCRQTLLPVWLFEYAYLSRRYRIAVNGATGKTVGDAPASIGKLALLAIAMLWLAVFVVDAETAVRLPATLFDALRSLAPSPAGT